MFCFDVVSSVVFADEFIYSPRQRVATERVITGRIGHATHCYGHKKTTLRIFCFRWPCIEMSHYVV